jgi:hypothetical protein
MRARGAGILPSSLRILLLICIPILCGTWLASCCKWFPSSSEVNYTIAGTGPTIRAWKDTSIIGERAPGTDTIYFDAYDGNGDTVEVIVRGNWVTSETLELKNYRFTYRTLRNDPSHGVVAGTYVAGEGHGSGTFSAHNTATPSIYGTTFNANYDLTLVNIADTTRTLRLNGWCSSASGREWCSRYGRMK